MRYMRNPKYSIGIDEAGRGPLAGPVHVGLVKVRHDFDFGIFSHLDDSKRMTEKRREIVFKQLTDLTNAVQVEVVSVTAAEIDEQGINPSIQSCINQGLHRLGNLSEAKVWFDGGLQTGRECNQETVVGGDGSIPVISLASVVAKVTRDRYMQELDRQFPVYGLAQHKGYGTAGHRKMIQAHGLSSAHRRSYTTNIANVTGKKK